jgi:hypothetical protein
MTENGCTYQLLPIKHELKLPSEVMPGLLVIQIQIQAMCVATNVKFCFQVKTFSLQKYDTSSMSNSTSGSAKFIIKQSNLCEHLHYQIHVFKIYYKTKQYYKTGSLIKQSHFCEHLHYQIQVCKIYYKTKQ